MNGKKQTPSEQMRKLMSDLNFESVNNKHDLKFNHGLSSYENPISTYFARHGFKQQTIYEGLIATYPIDKVIKWITDYFPTLKNLVKKKTASNGVEHILTIIPNVGDNASIIKRALDTCGYYPGLISFDVDATGIEWITIQFEPKFQKDETEYTNQPSLPEMIDKPQKDIFINKKDVPVIPMEDKQVEISYYYHDFWK